MHLNEHFEKIFCVNLEKRIDRREKAELQFKKLGISVDFFPAIDGSKIQNIPSSLNSGEVGCLLSHLEIYKKAIREGIGRYLVIEDDCEFDSNIHEKFERYYKEVPKDWDLLYFGGNHNGKEIRLVSEHVHRLHQTYTTHCYGVNTGFSQVLEKEIKIEKNNIKQIDVELSDIQSKYKCYGFIPHLAWQYDGYSDIVGDYRDYKFLKTHGNPGLK